MLFWTAFMVKCFSPKSEWRPESDAVDQLIQFKSEPFCCNRTKFNQLNNALVRYWDSHCILMVQIQMGTVDVTNKQV